MIKMHKEQTTKLYREIGERIYTLRNRRGYTRDELAERTGISVKFLYEIENGKKGFSVAVLYYLSNVLQVDMGYLVTGKDEIGVDQKIAATLELFQCEQAEMIDIILKEIYKLTQIKGDCIGECQEEPI